MKVNIYETVEVSDEQRIQIADLADRKVSKRQATREEIKDFIWTEGSGWELSLEALHRNFTKPDVEEGHGPVGGGRAAGAIEEAAEESELENLL
jgi:hypothetical protein